MSAGELDDALVADAQRGSPAALRAVYQALAPAVHGYLRAKGVADADGATNDVFLTVFARLGRITGGADGVRRFTFTIAHARMVDQLRDQSRRQVEVGYDTARDRRASASAEACAQARLGTARVREILEMLPADQREVVLLRVVADLSIEQVAEVIGRSPGAVKQLQRRGLLALRASVERGQVTL